MSVSAVLTDPVLTPKSDHRALLLKEKRWALAEELVSALRPYEKATSVLSGQQYLIMSSVLPITSGPVPTALRLTGKHFLTRHKSQKMCSLRAHISQGRPHSPHATPHCGA